MAKQQLWVIRAGSGGEVADKVEQASVVAIGWSQMGNLGALNTREETYEQVLLSI